MTTPTALRSWGRDWAYFKREWHSYLLASVLQPLLFLLGVGVGVGTLVDDGPVASDVFGDTSYFAFYASALLATTAMFTAAAESMWPTMAGFTWNNGYRAMIATAMAPRDVVAGVALRYAARTGLGAVGVGVVLALFDETRSWGLVPGALAGVLCGLAFGIPIAAWTATRTTDTSFPAIMRFGIIPMFLFGGAFYPIDQLPVGLRPVAWVTPLWHGVELCRGFVLGGTGAGMMALHTAVLTGFVVAGYLVALRTFDRRLRP